MFQMASIMLDEAPDHYMPSRRRSSMRLCDEEARRVWDHHRVKALGLATMPYQQTRSNPVRTAKGTDSQHRKM